VNVFLVNFTLFGPSLAQISTSILSFFFVDALSTRIFSLLRHFVTNILHITERWP